jgi:xylose isomerase
MNVEIRTSSGTLWGTRNVSSGAFDAVKRNAHLGPFIKSDEMSRIMGTNVPNHLTIDVMYDHGFSKRGSWVWSSYAMEWTWRHG